MKLTLHQAHSCFLKQFEYYLTNQPSSLPTELIDRFLYEAKIGFMRVGSRTPATSKMEFFVAIIKKWKLLNLVPKSSILML